MACSWDILISMGRFSDVGWYDLSVTKARGTKDTCTRSYFLEVVMYDLKKRRINRILFKKSDLESTLVGREGANSNRERFR